MMKLFTGNPGSRVDINSIKLLCAALLIHTAGPQTVIVLPGFIQGLVKYVCFSDKQAGFIASAELWGMTAAVIAITFLVGRLNWRRVFVIALFLIVIGNLISIFISDFYTFCVIRFLTGIGGGAIVVLSYAILGLTTKADRNFGLGIMFVLVYGAVVFPLMPLVYNAVGMTGVLLFFASVALIALPFVRYMPTSGEEHLEIDINAINIDWSRKSMALATMLFYFIANFAVWSYFFRMGVNAGLSEQEVGNGLSASQFLGIAGAFTAAVVGARFGRSLPLSLGIIGGAIPLLFLFSPISAFTYAVIASAYQFAWNMTHPYLLAAMASFDPTGKMVVYATCMQFIGVSIGPAIGAMVISTGNYNNVLILGISLFVVCLILILPPVIREAGMVRQ